jgi:hypothetical protein
MIHYIVNIELPADYPEPSEAIAKLLRQLADRMPLVEHLSAGRTWPLRDQAGLVVGSHRFIRDELREIAQPTFSRQ